MERITKEAFEDIKEKVNSQFLNLKIRIEQLENTFELNNEIIDLVWPKYNKIELTGKIIDINEDDINTIEFLKTMNELCRKHFGSGAYNGNAIIKDKTDQKRFIIELLDLTTQRIEILYFYLMEHFQTIINDLEAINLLIPTKGIDNIQSKCELPTPEMLDNMQPYYQASLTKLEEAKLFIHNSNCMLIEIEEIFKLRFSTLKDNNPNINNILN